MHADVLAALQHPVIGEIITAYSSTPHREYRCAIADATIPRRRAAASSWRYQR
jgi:hypothetical protein